MDLVFVGLVALFFAATWWLVRACDAMTPGGKGS
jgi:hypothetical protein